LKNTDAAMQIASTNNASPLPFTPATPSGGAASGENSPFAKMLSAQKQPGERPPEVQHQGGETKPAHAGEKTTDKVTEKPTHKAADESTGREAASDAAQAGDAESTPAAARRGIARNQPKLALRGRETTIGKPGAKATTDAPDAAKADATKDADKKDVAIEPGAADIAAQMNQPTPAQSAAAAPAGDAAVPLIDGTGKPAAAVGEKAGAATMTAATPEAAVAGKDKGKDGSRADVLDAKRESPFAQALKAEAGDAKHAAIDDKIAVAKETQEQRFELPGTRDVHAANHVSAPQAASGVDAPAASVSVDVPTPVTSPEFNEALGVQVSVLARDGVQEAQLHLNPAEMGPISVQIALDGTKAQVDFGADSLATRQIIESGLPELASALRDAGFTLAGGGVSQHSQQRQDERDGSSPGGSHASRRIGGVAEAAAPARRATVKMSQGGVDLYA
jgi:flagellar hook-length control protein FliK